MTNKYCWDCDNEECHNHEWLTFDEYSKIREEYDNKYLCPSCREERDKEYKKFENDMEELIRSNAKITSEPKAEYTLDLHYLATRNEELLKELDEKNNIIKIQSINNRVLLEEIIRLRENKND